MSNVSENRIPVVIGGGQINDRPEDPADGLEPLGLMTEALKRADADAGGGWLAEINLLAHVYPFSFRHQGDLSDQLAEAIGAKPEICFRSETPSGDSPIKLLNTAANHIGSGEIEVAAITGGEALRTEAGRVKAEAAAGTTATEKMKQAAEKRKVSFTQQYGVITPTELYPFFENAGRAAYGQSLEVAQAESAQIWSLMAEVASQTEGAWIRKRASPEEISTPTPANRPIAFPYTKLMVANSSVNQGAAFIVTSLARAKAAGVPQDNLIYVGRGAAAHASRDILARETFEQSLSMRVSLEKTLELNGLKTPDLDHVELYSCFPCVPKMARRVIDWPLNRPATVFGGLTFGGGPIGNYMSHAVICMMNKLREGGRHGLLFANGGFATHNHTIVLSRDRDIAEKFPHDFDFQHEVDARRGAVPELIEDYEGPGRIETYTVVYGRDGAPRFGVVVARTPEGERFLSRVAGNDDVGIAALTEGKTEPVGRLGSAAKRDDGLQYWTFAS